MKTVFFKTVLFGFPPDFAAEDIDFLLEMSPKARLLILAPGVDNVVDFLADDAAFMVFSLETRGRMDVDVDVEDGSAVDRGANMVETRELLFSERKCCD